MDPKTISKVKRIIRKWPAYRKFVESAVGDLAGITSLSQLPITDREFISQAIHTVPLYKVRTIIPTSGSSGSGFTFGLFGAAELRKSEGAIDSFLRNRLHTDRKKTLVLNMLPGSVTFHASSVTVASIGVRIDTAISAVKSLSGSFEQVILVGEPLFVKALIEAGERAGIIWPYMSLIIFVGGEWIPESYRQYLERMVGPQRVYSSMGMAELGLHHFHETEETIAFRRLLDQDRKLLGVLCGDVPFCPMLFTFDERSLIIESHCEAGEPLDSVLLTSLDPKRVLPLIRFRSGDKGMLLKPAQRSENAASAACPGKAPVLAHFGRGQHQNGIYPETVKELLYADHAIASAVTGNFQLLCDESKTVVHLQLSIGIRPDRDLRERCEMHFSGLPVSVMLHRFETFPSPLTFERKVQYVAEGCGGRLGVSEADNLSYAV
jgi:phenylacetate-coenzyme A ligase PaaK-like adenylate-forming protein